MQYFGSYAVLWLLCSTLALIQYFGSHTVLWLSYNTLALIQYFGSHTVLWLLYSTLVLIQYKSFINNYRCVKVELTNLKNETYVFFIVQSQVLHLFNKTNERKKKLRENKNKLGNEMD